MTSIFVQATLSGISPDVSEAGHIEPCPVGGDTLDPPVLSELVLRLIYDVVLEEVSIVRIARFMS